MAVKQNTTEGNDTPNPTGGAAGQVTASQTIGKSNNLTANGVFKNTNVTDEGSGGGVGEAKGISIGSNQNASAEHVDDGIKLSNGPIQSQFVSGSFVHDIKSLVNIIGTIQIQSLSAPERVILYERIIFSLSRTQIRNTPEDLKRFKEDILKVGAFLGKPNENNLLFFYLRIVYGLITQSAFETPSCAVAIVFHLFSPNLIIEAVQSLLEQNVLDSSIRKTVRLLCEWIRVCNFCQNLNLWIMALLNGLREQEKYVLLDEIALDNIGKLFSLMIFPALRPKVAPIVFHMLSNINQTPDIFHKILPKIPHVILYLKQQSTTTDDFGNESRSCIQKMVDITFALMLHFPDNDDLYESTKAALEMFEPSSNHVALARAMHENALPSGCRNVRVGLVNLGNTCYMNSVLQALAMTNDFSRQILLIESSSPLLLKVQQQIALMHHSMRYELTPSRVLSATRPPGFTPGLQQDSSEFLGYFLDLLHEHEISSPQHKIDESGTQQMETDERESKASASYLDDEISASGVIPYNNKDRELCAVTNSASSIISSSGNINTHSQAPSLNEPTPTKSTSKYEQLPKKPPSTIDKTFAGKLSTTYKCLNCDGESRNEDSFRELQLSFPDDKDDCRATNYSVQDLIEYYCSPEKLDGDNQYFCPRCKKLCDAERRIGITQAPRNLILTLKQFKYDQKYHFRTKLLHKVFHDESVAVKVCANDSLQELSTVHYDLYAGVVHAGYSMDSGHYFTFAADQSKNWYKFNDSLVTSSQPEEMHNLTSPNTPYILFYQMCGRSNLSSAAGSAAHTKIAVQLPQPLTLEELPRMLRDYVKQDNLVYSDELKIQRFKRTIKRSNDRGYGTFTRNSYDGDDDDHSPPPSGSCGGNDLGMGMNRFVY